MNDYSDMPSGEVLQGERAANRRYQWYEQIIADSCRHLVGTAHEIARSGFQIGIDELARRIRASEATARRERDELIERGHLIKFSGRGRRGKEACNRYGMVVKPCVKSDTPQTPGVSNLQPQICRSDTRRRVSDLTPDSPLSQDSPEGRESFPGDGGAVRAPSIPNDSLTKDPRSPDLPGGQNPVPPVHHVGPSSLAGENRDRGAAREQTVKAYRIVIKCCDCGDTSAHVFPVAQWQAVRKAVQQIECDYCGSKLGAEIDGSTIDYPKSHFDAERERFAARRAERDRRMAQVQIETPLDFHEDPDEGYDQDGDEGDYSSPEEWLNAAE
jgi:hypothetical protein